MPDSAGTIGGRIIQARLDAGAKRGRTFTQTELGRLVGVAPATVSQWESGTANPTLPNVERLAAALGVTPGWLAFGEPAGLERAPIAAPYYPPVVSTPEQTAAPVRKGAAAKRRSGGKAG